MMSHYSITTLLILFNSVTNTVVQSQEAVGLSAYFTSKQILYLGFVEQDTPTYRDDRPNQPAHVPTCMGGKYQEYLPRLKNTKQIYRHKQVILTLEALNIFM